MCACLPTTSAPAVFLSAVLCTQMVSWLTPSHQSGLSSHIASAKRRKSQRIGQLTHRPSCLCPQEQGPHVRSHHLHPPVTHPSLCFLWPVAALWPLTYGAAILRSTRIIRLSACRASRGHWWLPLRSDSSSWGWIPPHGPLWSFSDLSQQNTHGKPSSVLETVSSGMQLTKLPLVEEFQHRCPSTSSLLPTTFRILIGLT